MKTKTYEKIIDQTIATTVHICSFAILYLIWFGVFSFMAAILWSMTWSTYWVYLVSAIPTCLIFFYIVFFRKVVKRYGTVRLRDIWMYNATNLTYRVTDEELEECEEWIQENISSFHQIRTGPLDIATGKKRTFVFKKETDAMAFKLAWEGKLTSII